MKKSRVVEEHRTRTVACRHEPNGAVKQRPPAIPLPALLTRGLQDNRRMDALNQRRGRRLKAAMVWQFKHVDA